MLGFRTPHAKDVACEGIDHHRTRQILSVCLEALSKELVLPYCVNALEMGRKFQ